MLGNVLNCVKPIKNKNQIKDKNQIKVFFLSGGNTDRKFLI